MDATGIPELETARILRTNDASYANAVLRALARWRYELARANGMLVRQIGEEKAVLGVGVVVVRAGETPRAPVRPPTC